MVGNFLVRVDCQDLLLTEFPLLFVGDKSGTLSRNLITIHPNLLLWRMTECNGIPEKIKAFARFHQHRPKYGELTYDFE